MNWKVTLTRSYNTYNKELDSIYDGIAEGIRIRSKCDWYEHGEKFHKIVFESWKETFHQNQIRKLIFDIKNTWWCRIIT